jgi:hypothetical protein
MVQQSKSHWSLLGLTRGESEWGFCQVPIIRPNIGRRELPLDTARRRGVCQSGEGSESKSIQKAVPEATVFSGR